MAAFCIGKVRANPVLIARLNPAHFDRIHYFLHRDHSPCCVPPPSPSKKIERKKSATIVLDLSWDHFVKHPGEIGYNGHVKFWIIIRFW